jgi:ketosteroid isomerase-like protein
MLQRMLDLPDRLAAALVAIRPDNPDALSGLDTLYAEDMRFRDPIQQLSSRAAFLAMNERLLARMRSLTWQIHHADGDDDRVMLEWTMHCTAKLGVKLAVDGTTVARARDGLIIDHRDYWDLGEMFASSLPWGLRLLHAVRRPFA